jgi:hypothetical protein
VVSRDKITLQSRDFFPVRICEETLLNALDVQQDIYRSRNNAIL